MTNTAGGSAGSSIPSATSGRSACRCDRGRPPSRQADRLQAEPRREVLDLSVRTALVIARVKARPRGRRSPRAGALPGRPSRRPCRRAGPRGAREGEVAPPALVLRLVHLEDVLEVEQLLRPRAVVDEPVERRRSAVRPSKSPSSASGSMRLPGDPLHGGRLAGVPDVDRLDRHLRCPRAAIPSDRRRRPFLIRSASSTEGTTRRPGRPVQVRSQSRSRPSGGDRDSPRIIRSSSIWVTLRLFVHPATPTALRTCPRRHATSAARSPSRSSRRKESLPASQARILPWGKSRAPAR